MCDTNQQNVSAVRMTELISSARISEFYTKMCCINTGLNTAYMAHLNIYPLLICSQTLDLS